MSEFRERGQCWPLRSVVSFKFNLRLDVWDL